MIGRLLTKGKLLCSLAAMAFLFSSCDQKDLCFDHWEHAPKLDFYVNINWEPAWEYQYPGGPDWKATWDAAKFGMTYDSLLPGIPEGVRVMVYDSNGYADMQNVGRDGGQVFITEGEHQMLFFNNDTEYIVFKDLAASAMARASTREVTRSTFDPRGGGMEIPGAELTVNPPDYLFAHYIEKFDAQRSPDRQEFSVTMRPLVFTYLIRYKVQSGFEYAALARGALSGVASTVYLTDGTTAPEAATILFDCEIKDGYFEAKVNSFGAPNYPNPHYTRTDQPYRLNLEVRLTNGEIKDFDFDITAQMSTQPRGGVVEVSGIDIPEPTPEVGSGFDVTVDGWGEVIDVPIM